MTKSSVIPVLFSFFNKFSRNKSNILTTQWTYKANAKLAKIQALSGTFWNL